MIIKQMAETKPLSSPWTFWFHKNDMVWGRETYEKICTVKTVQEFVEVLNTIPTYNAGIFFLMRDQVFPMWEDPENIKGGYWSFKVNKRNSDKIWENICSACIGNTIMRDPSNMKYINGLSFSPKINNVIIKILNNNSSINSTELITRAVSGIVPNDANYRPYCEISECQ